MILTREEISFLDVYCYEGTEPPFGGPATDAMRSIGIQSGDTLNLQWAYLRGKPPTGQVIGKSTQLAPPVPWASREAVLRRDEEIRAIREDVQRLRASTRRRKKARRRRPVYTMREPLVLHRLRGGRPILHFDLICTDRVRRTIARRASSMYRAGWWHLHRGSSRKATGF
jgi:hypothetical protein